MGAVRLLLDTNVLVHIIDGTRQPKQLFEKETDLAISIVSWMEFMVGRSYTEELTAREFLSNFQVIEISQEIAEEAVRVRGRTRAKLPDSVIYATALVNGRTLLTYNTRDFQAGMALVEIPEA